MFVLTLVCPLFRLHSKNFKIILFTEDSVFLRHICCTCIKCPALFLHYKQLFAKDVSLEEKTKLMRKQNKEFM